jgi:hypothetical protein
MPFALTLLLALQDPAEPASKLIEQLRSDQVARRDEATQKLRKLGLAAVAELQKAAKDPDAEVAVRARDLLVSIEKDEQERREAQASEWINQCLERLEQAKELQDPKQRIAKFEEALALTRKIGAEGKGTRQFGPGQFNAGVILADFLGRPQEAIGEFQKVIDSDVDDKEETGNIVTPYRNYRYHARRMMSLCYEKLGKRGLALDMAFRMKEAYVSHCGNCIASMNEGVRERVKALCVSLEGSDAALVGEAVDGAKGADQLLLELGRKYRERNNAAAAKAALSALATDLPKSDRAAEAAKLLEALKKM